MAERGPGREPTVSDDVILNVFREAEDPVLTTAEVAEQLDIERRGTYYRLQKLVDEGVLKMKKPGGTGAVWWHPESLKNQYSEE